MLTLFLWLPPADIEGARVDDLKYLKDHHIDRNQVSQELTKIFSQMVYINGCKHVPSLVINSEH